MDCLQLRQRLTDLGISITTDQGQLIVQPASLLTDDLRSHIRELKPDLIRDIDSTERQQFKKVTFLDELQSLTGEEYGEPITFDSPTVADDFDPVEYLTPSALAELDRPLFRPEPCQWCGGRNVHNSLCFCVAEDGRFILTFGQHRGKAICHTPPGYLRWLICSRKQLTSEQRYEIRRTLHKHGCNPFPDNREEKKQPYGC